ncbi:MAG: flagellar basal body P-ring protein FlgI [Alphaproteobacteria bacterium]|nr:flagellar basal body P-ring protein FlgI [Alphaproteobacteria bacterium]MDE2161528.1 flagellar basal body P-ring protein FlgI [Alphaproteobacteria bacterium]MDE2266567.1 flagellar basal body P-ring protein FlgI [Alphaproteobacteria bacterium]MDE2499914.1 flagellar basal body P-ring protein FlgI [Alphaproteobacteria bacterium]
MPLPRLYMKRVSVALLAAIMAISAQPAFAYSRVKDLVDVQGIRDNMLVGYGLVVGLNGTGDSLKNAPFTQQSLQTMLERLGVNTRGQTMQTKNVAAVMVTANLPAFSGEGTRIDISVSAMGDAKSLQGGTLLVTPLFGADGQIYALGQGPVAIGGFSAQGQAASVTRGVPTAGRISNGAIVEKEINFSLASEHNLKLSLHNPDLTTATRIAAAVNTYLGTTVATATDPSTVDLAVPANYPNGVVGLLTDIDQVKVDPDQPAKVVIDETSGVIVMGADVRISTVAIAQGNLTIRVNETPQVSQPAPFSNTGTTQTVPRTQIQIDDSKGNKMTVLHNGVALQNLVDGLNALGVGPRDIISILQAIKAAGALQADIQVIG